MTTQRRLSTLFPTSFPLALCAALLAVLAVATGLSLQQAHAQDITARQTTAPMTRAQAADSSQAPASLSIWTKHFGDQLRHLLERSDRERQEEAMLLILEHTRRPFDQARGDAAVDFRPAVASLFDIYESDAPTSHRMLALAVLDAIGEPRVMEQLAQQVQTEAPGPVRRQALHVLAQHRN